MFLVVLMPEKSSYFRIECYLHIYRLVIQQKIVNVKSQDPVFIIMRGNYVFSNNNFFERIVYISERTYFLSTLIFIRYSVCRLNVTAFRSEIANEINLKLLAYRVVICIFLTYLYEPDINTIMQVVGTSHEAVVNAINDDTFQRLSRLCPV